MGARIFVSHTDEDIERCGPLLKVLGEWQIPCYFDAVDRRGGQALSGESQQALKDCDVMLRVCTRYTNRSYWMSIEAGALLSLQADDHRAGQDGRHKIVNLILDKAYTPEPFDITSQAVDATYTLSAVWVNDLRRALDLPPLMDIAPIAQRINPAPVKKMSRRAVVGVGVAGAIVVAGGAAGGYALLQRAARPKTKPPSTDPSLRWWYLAADAALSIPGTGVVTASPVVADNAVYIATTQGKTLALTLSGAKLWEYTLTLAAPIYQAPAVANGAMYVVGKSLGVVAVQNGAALWSHGAAPFTFSRTVIAGGALFVNSPDYLVFVSALDINTGAQQFTISPTLFSPGTSGVAVANGMLYAGGQDGNMYAFDLAKPQAGQVWSAQVGASRDDKEGVKTYYVFPSPVVADGVVYAVSTDHNIYALDAATGAQRWAYVAQAEFVNQGPAVANGIVYASSFDNVLHAVDTTTGKQLWSHAFARDGLSAPVAARGAVYVGTGDHAVYALDARTGAVRRTYTTASTILAPPAVAGSVLYAADITGYVYAFSLA